MNIHISGERTNRFFSLERSLVNENFRCIFFSLEELPVDAGAITCMVLHTPSQALARKIHEMKNSGCAVIVMNDTARVHAENTVLYIPGETSNQLVIAVIRWIIGISQQNLSLQFTEEGIAEFNSLLQKQTASLQSALEELDDKKKRIVEELTLASELQKSFLPKSFPRDIAINFTHKYIPHEYIGGDFFEIITIDHEHLGIIIADVSGHGVASALITAMFKSVFNHVAKNCLSPMEVLAKINAEFVSTIRTEHYITAFYIIINTENFTCTYSTAGHPAQLLIRGDGTVEPLSAQGFFIGMFDQTQYENLETVIQPGDRLLLYTDGIIECQNDLMQPFGKERLSKIFQENKDMDIENLSKTVISELVAFMTDNRFPDDVTLLVAERLPEL
ncbi:MAG: serine/threonine-protein phosphatase [Spirochaetaceae bacterium]|nr:MAG: serine/threonine-protein phosphatase [Spirochaetaceae bacterium]